MRPKSRLNSRLANGDAVVATSRTLGNLRQAFGEDNTRVLALEIDLNSEASVQSAIEKTIATFGRIAQASLDLHLNTLEDQQAGDPEKLATLILQAASLAEPPIHLFAGKSQYVCRAEDAGCAPGSECLALCIECHRFYRLNVILREPWRRFTLLPPDPIRMHAMLDLLPAEKPSRTLESDAIVLASTRASDGHATLVTMGFRMIGVMARP